jgi:hypothetical protein
MKIPDKIRIAAIDAYLGRNALPATSGWNALFNYLEDALSDLEVPREPAGEGAFSRATIATAISAAAKASHHNPISHEAMRAAAEVFARAVFGPPVDAAKVSEAVARMEDAGIVCAHTPAGPHFSGALENMARIGEILDAVSMECALAEGRFPGYNSAHEGYAVILEKLDKVWEHVKVKQSKRDLAAMRKEAIQVAACAVRFVLHVCNETGGRK